MRSAVAADQQLEHRRHRPVALVSTVDLRSVLDLDECVKTPANFVSGVRTFHEVSDETTVWELAREVGRDVQRHVEQNESLLSLYLQTTNTRLSLLTGRAPYTVFLTNLGESTVEYPAEALATFGAPTIHGLGSAFYLFAGTILGRLYLVHAWPFGALDESATDEYQRVFSDELDSLTSTAPDRYSSTGLDVSHTFVTH
jgi:hypothetical protein